MWLGFTIAAEKQSASAGQVLFRDALFFGAPGGARF